MMFRVFRTNKQYNEWIIAIHDHWTHDDYFTYVVVSPCVIRDTSIEWSVEEIGHEWGDHVTLGYFESLSRACQFAHCYASNDYDWYNDNIPWHDEVIL